MIPYYSVVFAKATFVSKSILIQTCTVRSGHPWSDPFVVKMIKNNLFDQYNTRQFCCQHIHIIILYNGLPVHLSAKNKRVNRSLAATRLCAIFNPLLLPSDMLLQPQKRIPPSFWRLPDSSYPAYACLALLPVLLLTEPPSCPLHVRF